MRKLSHCNTESCPNNLLLEDYVQNTLMIHLMQGQNFFLDAVNGMIFDIVIWACQHVLNQLEVVQLFTQSKVPCWQAKFLANTFHMFSFPVGSIIAKCSIHFFQGLYHLVNGISMERENVEDLPGP